MTPGEKRSLTSSMKKATESFTKNPSDFVNKESFISEFYNFWINYSIDNKLSWCFDKKTGLKEYQNSQGFKEEMVIKITDLFSEVLKTAFAKVTNVKEITSLKEIEKKIRPIRSKKKRIRKKYEKKNLAV